MKISILLPYKENFSPTYAGAVSLNINETLKISKYRKNTTVFGNTEYRNKFKHRYVNIPLKKIIFQSQNKKYNLNEIVKGESIFCATGITSGDLVNGVKCENGKFITETLVTHKNSSISIVKKEVPILD